MNDLLPVDATPQTQLYSPLPKKQEECYLMLQRDTVPELMHKFQPLKKMLTAYQPIPICASTPSGAKTICY